MMRARLKESRNCWIERKQEMLLKPKLYEIVNYIVRDNSSTLSAIKPISNRSGAFQLPVAVESDSGM